MPPDFKEPQFKSPLMGSIHNFNPEARTADRSRCFERGYHRGPDADGQCFDCGGRAGLPFRTEAEIPKAKPQYTERPPVVAHNEHATFDELMAERGLTPEEHRVAQAKRAAVLAGAEPEMPTLDKEQATRIGEAYLRVMKTPENVKRWCAELGIPLVADGGVYLHLEAKLKAAEKRIEELKKRIEELNGKLVEARKPQPIPDNVDPSPAGQAATGTQTTDKSQTHADHEGGL